MKRILFVCVENSNRSQMAEAFARMHGTGKVEAYSAGSRPAGRINPTAIAAMQELGYDLSTHASKGLDHFNGMKFDAAVTMGCGDACPLVLAKERLDWAIPDPRDMTPEQFRDVRNGIEAKVKELIQALLHAEKPEIRPRRPLLVRHARYRWDELRRQHQLLFPEGVLVLNDSAAAIVRLCDGRSLDELLAGLEEQFATTTLRQEVLDILDRLSQKGLLRDADA
jgi:coenzyme PQQ biosynthesis protein PqqD